MMKLCKDCKWVEVKRDMPEGVWLCNAPSNTSQDLVDGESKRLTSLCREARKDDLTPEGEIKSCGRSGRWWEPKGEEQLK